MTKDFGSKTPGSQTDLSCRWDRKPWHAGFPFSRKTFPSCRRLQYSLSALQSCESRTLFLRSHSTVVFNPKSFLVRILSFRNSLFFFNVQAWLSYQIIFLLSIVYFKIYIFNSFLLFIQSFRTVLARNINKLLLIKLYKKNWGEYNSPHFGAKYTASKFL